MREPYICRRKGDKEDCELQVHLFVKKMKNDVVYVFRIKCVKLRGIVALMSHGDFLSLIFHHRLTEHSQNHHVCSISDIENITKYGIFVFSLDKHIFIFYIIVLFI